MNDIERQQPRESTQHALSTLQGVGGGLATIWLTVFFADLAIALLLFAGVCSLGYAVSLRLKGR